MNENDEFFPNITKMPYLKRYLDLSPDLSCICNHKKEIVYANTAFSNFTASSIEDIKGQDLLTFLNQQITILSIEEVKEFSPSETSGTSFKSIHLVSNNHVIIEWQLVFDDELKLYFYTGRKVTKSSMVETTKSELLSLAFDRATDAIIIAENVGTYESPKPAIVYANQTFVDYSGYAPDEILDKNPSFMRGEGNSPETINKMRRAIKNWEPVNIEVLNRTKKSEKIWVSLSIVPIKNKKGRYTHWISIQRDITEQKMREAQLRIFQSAVEHSRDSILITKAEPIDQDQNGPEIIYANDAFVKLTGFSKEETLHKTPRILQGEETSKEANQNIRKALEAWKPITQEVLNYKKNGEKFWLELSIFPVADEKGWFTHWVSFQRDITEKMKARKELELKVKERTKALKKVNEKLKAFASVASHDLKAPLRMINSYLEIVKKRIDNKLPAKTKKLIEEELHMINLAQMGVVEANNLITGILNYSNIEQGKDDWEILDFSELLEKQLFLLRIQLEKTDTEITVGDLPKIIGNKVQIKQLFQNIITNAIKFRSPERKCKIEIKSEKIDNGYLFSIQDNGIGMRKEDNKVIFNIFKRAKTDKKYPGQGIGLSICKEIVENHNGKIWVESISGQGSTFYFTLMSQLS